MNYLDVYYSRVNHMGETTGERIRNGGIRSFERWKEESPFTVRNLSVERNIYFTGIIETNKDKEAKKIMFLYVSLDIPIRVGDIMYWPQEDGTVEKWLLLQKEKEANPKYQTFWILKCNYQIKWIDVNGRLRKSWCYVVSSEDSKIKGNFRTWHNLISPQPNKYAEIIMPYPGFMSKTDQPINRSTNFIIEDEGWLMIESDFTSVEGIMYMSLTESKVNYQYDDLDADVADTDRLAFPTLKENYLVGEELVPDFGENTFNEWQLEYNINNSDVVALVDNVLKAIGPGDAIISMQLRGRPAVVRQYQVHIDAIDTELRLYISGPDELKLDRESSYQLVRADNDEPLGEIVVFSLEDANGYVSGKTGINYNTYEPLPNLFIVHANNKNKLGSVVLTATYNNQSYTKKIQIVPLW